MPQDSVAHLPVITGCLTRMQVDPTLRAYELLSEGISGSNVYCGQGNGSSAILKFTRAATPPCVQQRAARKLAFCQHLFGE